VWLVGLTVFGPAVGGLLLHLSNSAVWWRHLGVLAVLAFGLWLCLLAGREFAFVGWIVTAILTGGQVMASGVYAAVSLAEVSATGRPTADHLIGFGVLLAGGMTAALLVWPETRRWCAVFPPDDEND
jgi:hypothetical protein